MSRTVHLSSLCLLLMSTAVANGLVAQSAVPTRLTVIVRDATKEPVVGAVVSIDSLSDRTDEHGVATLRQVPVGAHHVSIRRLGFDPRQVNATVSASGTDTLRVELQGAPAELADVVVTAGSARKEARMREFNQRRAGGVGAFITREEIEKQHPYKLSDMMRRIPSVRVDPDAGNMQSVVRMSRAPKNCTPQYFIDGMRIEGGSLDEFHPGDVEGIEIYAGASTTPPQFLSRLAPTSCGTIVIWSRLPGR